MILALLVTTIGLIVDPEPSAPIAVTLVGTGLWTLGTAGVIGMTISRSRWAYLTAWMVILAVGVLAVITPIGVFWAISVALGAATAVGLIGLGARSIVRGRPAASGPPVAAVAVPVVMAATPLLLGFSSWSDAGWLELVIGVSGPLVALWFMKTLPGALIMARVLWPACLLGAAPWMEPTSMVTTTAIAVVVALAAWRPEVKTSVRPLTTRGSRVPIPPELAPRDVLDSAGLDDRGRRK